MGNPSRTELYATFLEFVMHEDRRERSAANQKFFHVFLWCFLIPIAVAAIGFILGKLGLLPSALRSRLDWVLLLFPVLYSIYFLGSEVLTELPTAFRRGGLATTLAQAHKEGVWREEICQKMSHALKASRTDWQWIATNFRIDLDRMQYRIRYLSALTGAVLFLIVQGLDTSDEHIFSLQPVSPGMFLDWFAVASDALTGFVLLILFVVLLYLSANHMRHTLGRYLDCLELLVRTSDKSR